MARSQNSSAREGSSFKAPSLRPPTLMIDLLFGALMLFAFQMGDPSSTSIVPRHFDLPTSEQSAGKTAARLLPLTPVAKLKGKWLYEDRDGRHLTASEVAATAKQKGKTPILLVPKTASVQNYLDAEQPLRLLGLKVGLAVDSKGDNQK